MKKEIENGYRFAEPEAVKQARKEYMATNSTVISFFDECMVRRPGGTITDGCTTGMIYRACKEWCKENNHGFAKTAREFRNELSAHLGTTFEEMTALQN